MLRLRAAGHSITEIEQALATTATPLNRTGVWELLRDEGYERLAIRPPDQRGSPRREHPPRTRRIAWPPQPLRLPADYAGCCCWSPAWSRSTCPQRSAPRACPAPARSPPFAAC